MYWIFKTKLTFFLFLLVFLPLFLFFKFLTMFIYMSKPIAALISKTSKSLVLLLAKYEKNSYFFAKFWLFLMKISIFFYIWFEKVEKSEMPGKNRHIWMNFDQNSALFTAGKYEIEYNNRNCFRSFCTAILGQRGSSRFFVPSALLIFAP